MTFGRGRRVATCLRTRSRENLVGDHDGERLPEGLDRQDQANHQRLQRGLIGNKVRGFGFRV